MPTDFDVAISSPVRDEEVQAVAQELEALGATVLVDNREGRPQASISFLAGALVFLITRKYFETLLQEAAKDHYQVLKRGVSRLLKARQRYELTRVVSSSTPNKGTGEDARVFSVSFIEEPGAVVKFAFTGATNDEHASVSLERLFGLLEAYCRGGADPRVEVLRTMIHSGPGAWRYVLVFDEDRGQWVPADLIAGLYPAATPDEYEGA